MAEVDPTQHGEPLVEESDRKLKHLEFVQVAAIYAAVCFLTVYEYVKDKAGPLKPGVEAIEATVKTIVAPVYGKFHDVPLEFLRFLDRKVEELERHVPSVVKQASAQACTVASEVQRAGVVDAARRITNSVYKNYEPTAKELYLRYEPTAERYAVSAWRALNRLPIFPEVAEIVVPTAGHWSEKYNQLVCLASDRGYELAMYLPLIPVEKIAKVFKESHPPEESKSGEAAVGVAQ